MPKSWSNTHYIDPRSAAQRAKERPTSVTIYVVLLILICVLFGGLMVYTTTHTELHPTKANFHIGTQDPKDE